MSYEIERKFLVQKDLWTSPAEGKSLQLSRDGYTDRFQDTQADRPEDGQAGLFPTFDDPMISMNTNSIFGDCWGPAPQS